MSQDWGAELTGRIAAEIKRLRVEKRGSGQWLSDQTAELGHRVSRSTISEIENGKRQSIAVDALIVLAAALEVRVADLIYPGTGFVEVLPGVMNSRAAALDRLVDLSIGRERLLEAYVAIRDDFINLGLSLTGQEPEQSWARLMTPEEVRTGHREPSATLAETAAGDPANIAKDFFFDNTTVPPAALPSTTHPESGDGR